MTETEVKDWAARKMSIAHRLRHHADRLENIRMERRAWVSKVTHDMTDLMVDLEELERDA